MRRTSRPPTGGFQQGATWARMAWARVAAARGSTVARAGALALSSLASFEVSSGFLVALGSALSIRLANVDVSSGEGGALVGVAALGLGGVGLVGSGGGTASALTGSGSGAVSASGAAAAVSCGAASIDGLGGSGVRGASDMSTISTGTASVGAASIFWLFCQARLSAASSTRCAVAAPAMLRRSARVIAGFWLAHQ